MSEGSGQSTWVVISPHEAQEITRDPDELDDLVLRLLQARSPMNLSLLWKATNCHLWELDASLRRLKDKGLLSESDP